jgi:hypothetical protein
MTIQLTEQNQILAQVAEGLLAWARKEEGCVTDLSTGAVDLGARFSVAADNLMELAKLNKVWYFNPLLEGTIDLDSVDMMQIRLYVTMSKDGVQAVQNFQVA